MLLWVLEYRDPENPYEFPPQPARLDLGPLLGPFECVGERTHLMFFRQAGRFFQVHVMFGPKAPATLRAGVVAALSSFTAESRGASTRQQCQQGAWISCPEAAWVFEIINKAGLFHQGNVGTAIQAGPQDAKVNIWAAKAGPSGLQSRYQPLTEAGGVTVYGNSATLVWEAQGHDILVQRPTGSSAPLPSGKTLQRLVRASLQIPFVDDQS
jgi:hypothetical protein